MSDDVQATIDRFLTRLDATWSAGYTAVLFGSAARGQHIPGWSDINLLLLVDRLGAEDLARVGAAFRTWRDETDAMPLLFGTTEWRRSADAYPLEIAEMRTAYRVLRGGDPLVGMTVRPVDLRAALEREFRGKLMRLRQGWALLHERPAELSDFVQQSIPSVLVLCRGLLVLVGVQPPAEPDALIRETARVAGFPVNGMAEIVAHRADGAWRMGAEGMAGYLAAVETTARFIDTHKIGERA